MSNKNVYRKQIIAVRTGLAISFVLPEKGFHSSFPCEHSLLEEATFCLSL